MPVTIIAAAGFRFRGQLLFDMAVGSFGQLIPFNKFSRICYKEMVLS